jgi:hypothetical protein
MLAAPLDAERYRADDVKAGQVEIQWPLCLFGVDIGLYED